MPNPKRRHSKSRRNQRRAHDALVARLLTRCLTCQEFKLPHRICGSCGHYRGRLTVQGTLVKRSSKGFSCV